MLNNLYEDVALCFNLTESTPLNKSFSRSWWTVLSSDCTSGYRYTLRMDLKSNECEDKAWFHLLCEDAATNQFVASTMLATPQDFKEFEVKDSVPNFNLMMQVLKINIAIATMSPKKVAEFNTYIKEFLNTAIIGAAASTGGTSYKTTTSIDATDSSLAVNLELYGACEGVQGWGFRFENVKGLYKFKEAFNFQPGLPATAQKQAIGSFLRLFLTLKVNTQFLRLKLSVIEFLKENNILITQEDPIDFKHTLKDLTISNIYSLLSATGANFQHTLKLTLIANKQEELGSLSYIEIISGWDLNVLKIEFKDKTKGFEKLKQYLRNAESY